jgi:MFS family permease
MANNDLPTKKSGYMPFLLFISGMGGLVAGVDFGIIGSALEFLNKTIQVTEAQLSFIVAIYTGGGVLASFFAGLLSDLLGRKKMMMIGGVSFVFSILLIYTSQGFVPLMCGRILMGLSGGIICVVVPLYMAECLSAEIRGRGTALFQFMLTLGMVTAGAIGVFFTNRNAESVAIAQQMFATDITKLNEAVFKANSEAWRYMFLVAAIPGAIFSIGAIFIKESPRWLFRRGRHEQAKSVLLLSLPEDRAAAEINEYASHSKGIGGEAKQGAKDSLLQRKYVVPFVIACIILAATQATGINSVIAYSVVILKQAGLDAISASWGFTTIMTLNCVMTLAGAALVDKVGRKFLLKMGTIGIIVTLVSTALVYRTFESKQAIVSDKISGMIADNGLQLNIMDIGLPNESAVPMQLSILYSYGGKQQMARVFMPTPEDENTMQKADAVIASMTEDERIAFNEAKEYKGRDFQDLTELERDLFNKAGDVRNKLNEIDQKYLADAEGIRAAQLVSIAPDSPEAASAPLVINRAKWGPIPTPATGWTVTVLLCLFVTCFAVGPGVCVWLALTELMPTRIRSMGMGIAMVLNNGVQFVIALAFLPVVGQYGFSAMFFFWAACTVVYFITAAFFMPETKGKTLEEIEDYFTGKAK